jgi:hypothetical protein
VIYARPFFDLQLRFARAAADLSALPLSHTLMEYTSLYARFGLGRDFDAGHPVWRAYLAGLGNGDDEAWTYRYYVDRGDSAPPPELVASFGCFEYSRLGADRLRMHFRNVEPDGRSPLAAGCLPRRRADLAALFAHVTRTQPEVRTVVGASWLYNVEAYRRLFPSSYVASAHVLRGRFQAMPLWGQFLDRRGELREDATREFLLRLGRQSSVDGLDDCFPLPVLRLEAPVRDFVEFFRT